ncbi:alpha-hydroxy-acid oxidizing protein [Eubacteriales bacterium OttesenSCG-928-A19]|nr:alpha-hydroxy-acid oxidizing protein [Eubacteriales bacterium OttesenSCG-928-A19]
MELKKSGDSIQITREYYDSFLIEMRHLDAAIPSTKTEVLGETFETPIMMAALSHLERIRENGMVLMAKGAKAAGSVMWCGMGDEQELERIVETGARTVKIIKPYADRKLVYAKIAHAKACGALAVGMDIDHQFSGKGKPDVVAGQAMTPVSSEELSAFIRASDLPFVVKGILSVQDAVKCAAAGAAGIVISHHNGLVPYSVPPLMILPEIVDAVSGKMQIFVDCGVASGADAFKALALGADAVSVGKPMMAALKENGADAVTERINDMTGELAGIMARTCMARIGEINPSVLRRK